MSFNCPFCSAILDSDASACAQCGEATDPLLKRGERVAQRFQIVDVVACGVLGTTYRAQDTASNSQVLLKTLADDVAPTELDRRGFVSRIEMFAGRTLAGCVMPLEVGYDARVAYVTVLAVDGVSLRAVLAARQAERRPLTLEEALRLLLALSASLSALHSATPHGALSPETVLVTPHGLLLTDCAVAVAAGHDKLKPRLARFARAGAYVAPEAARGKRMTASSDLFALGAIAAELLTGSPSFRALDAVSLDPVIHGALRALLDSEPAKRPGAVGTLLDGLARVSGFDRRPAQPPLPVPEACVSDAAVGPSNSAALSALASSPAPAIARPVREPPASDDGGTFPGRRVARPVEASREPDEAPTPFDDPPATSVYVPKAASRGRTPNDVSRADGSPAGIPGRLGPATVSRPAAPRSAGPASGPPGGLDSVRSGPPDGSRASTPTSAPARAGSRAAEPQRNAARPRGADRDLDGIDPRLVRAARKLEAERGANAADGEELDAGEIEVVDE